MVLQVVAQGMQFIQTGFCFSGFAMRVEIHKGGCQCMRALMALLQIDERFPLIRMTLSGRPDPLHQLTGTGFVCRQITVAGDVLLERGDPGTMLYQSEQRGQVLAT